MEKGFYKSAMAYIHSENDIVTILQYGGSDVQRPYYIKNQFAVDSIIVISQSAFDLVEEDYINHEFDRWSATTSSEFFHAKNSFLAFLTDTSRVVGIDVEGEIKKIEDSLEEATLVYSTDSNIKVHAEEGELLPEDEIIILERNIWDLEKGLQDKTFAEKYEECITISAKLDKAGKRWRKLHKELNSKDE